MPVSKPFVIATEGQTVDGRNISRDEIQQMAAHYDPKVFTANANLEHLLSFSPESIFSAYGPVLKLSTQEATILGEKKLQLMGVVDANESIISMQKVGKKAFASIEITKNFLGKGIAYLTGLAFTDTPASVGTESMKFSANAQNVYSFKDEVEVIFDTDAAKDKSGETLLSKVIGLLGGKDKKDEAKFTDIGQAVEAIAISQKEALEKFSVQNTTVSELRAELVALKSAIEAGTAEFSKIKAEVDKLTALPNGQASRPTASGGDGAMKTDC